ncbi:MAG: HEAT repeat domain-containing protein [Armatimonadetes bacterium]|nr:HEAT repeat domain-containing protein [Armatimonadota bacterium]
MTNPSEIQALIDMLDTTDPVEQRRISERILSFGSEAAPALREALLHGTPPLRKASAYLLGALKAGEAVEDLSRAVGDDPEAKVRQNAAVALGKIAAPESVTPLIRALERETMSYVRSSLYLALGALEGEGIDEALRQHPPGDDPREREAYRKALDRASPPARPAEWNPDGFPLLDLYVDAPLGLEAVAQEEADERGLSLTPSPLLPGLLRCPPHTPPTDLIPALRCVYGVMIHAGEVPPLSPDDPSSSVTTLDALSQLPLLSRWREWVSTDRDAVQYRLSVQGISLRRDMLRRLLSEVRSRLIPLGWRDSPSRYDVELILHSGVDAGQVFIRPRFMNDSRFAYRVKDVGAAIHPVVGACLARLCRTPGGGRGVVFDPTCGSGTLLIERALLDNSSKSVGLDVSPTAVTAARTNVGAAGLASRIQIHKGDASRPESWPECREVLANLPFGMRTKREKHEIAPLYDALLHHLSDRLQPQGRAVLYSASRQLLDESLARQKKHLQTTGQLKVFSGGLWIHIRVLERRE